MTADVSEGGILIGAQAFLDLSSKVDQMHRRMNVETRPVLKPVGNSGVVPAGGNLQLILSDSPARGRMWNILKIIICGTDLHTTVAGTADVYSGDNPELQGVSIINGILSAVTMPNITSFSRLVEWCPSGENIFANITGATPGAIINLIARVAEYPVEAVEAMTIG